MPEDVAPAPAANRRSLLVVVSPGLNYEKEDWDRLRDALIGGGAFADYGQVTWRLHDHGLGVLSTGHMEQRVRDLRAWISQRWLDGGFTDLMLVGHSTGGALIRQAWLDASDPAQGEDFVEAEWADKVRRIVLFAGVSRGVDYDSAFHRRLQRRLFEHIPIRFAVQDLLRGSIFLSNLRISWMRRMASLDRRRRPVIAHVIGTRDSLVTRADSLDTQVRQRSMILEIDGADHGDVHHLRTREQRDERLKSFVAAFRKAPTSKAMEDEAAEGTVLMIVHGIRASRTDDWVQRAEAMVAADQRWQHVVTRAPSYGYLSAIRFALPWVRHRYARHFRDFYTETLALYPRARFNVLCHSNGTYLLGHSLRQFDSIHVDRIALAGSVLPAEFEWSDIIARGQARHVRSDGGASDWPVGLLCSALRALGMRDVGTGGYSGFLCPDVKDVRFHRGGHGAMLEKQNLVSMLEFLLAGGKGVPRVSHKGSFNLLSRSMRWLAPVVAGLIVLVVAVAGMTGGWIGFGVSIGVVALLLIVLDVI